MTSSTAQVLVLRIKAKLIDVSAERTFESLAVDVESLIFKRKRKVSCDVIYGDGLA